MDQPMEENPLIFKARDVGLSASQKGTRQKGVSPCLDSSDFTHLSRSVSSRLFHADISDSTYYSYKDQWPHFQAMRGIHDLPPQILVEENYQSNAEELMWLGKLGRLRYLLNPPKDLEFRRLFLDSRCVGQLEPSNYTGHPCTKSFI